LAQFHPQGVPRFDHYLPGQGDFEIRNEWAEYFAGLKGDLLILDSTTGPGPSGLTIWDLKKRKKVYEGSWSDPEESKDDSLVYWTETGEGIISVRSSSNGNQMD
jgi:hypothetical protein